MNAACVATLHSQGSEKRCTVIRKKEQTERDAEIALESMVALRGIYCKDDEESGGFSIRSGLSFKEITLTFRNIWYVKLIP